MKMKTVKSVLLLIVVMLFDGCSSTGEGINLVSLPKLFIPESVLKEDSIVVNTKNKHRVNGVGMLGSSVALCYVYNTEIDEEDSFKIRYKFEDMGYGFTSPMEGKYWDLTKEDYLLYKEEEVGNKKVLCKRRPVGPASIFRDFKTGFLTPEMVDEKANKKI